MLTVQKELKILLARSEKPSSQSLPPICTPEKKKENTVVSPERKKENTVVTPEKKSTVVSSKMDTSLPLLDLSPITSHTSPPKSKVLYSCIILIISFKESYYINGVIAVS